MENTVKLKHSSVIAQYGRGNTSICEHELRAYFEFPKDCPTIWVTVTDQKPSGTRYVHFRKNGNFVSVIKTGKKKASKTRHYIYTPMLKRLGIFSALFDKVDLYAFVEYE